MELDRRDFLKLAGLIGLGVAVKPALDVLSPADAQKELTTTDKHAGKRLAMVVQPKLCPDGCNRCIEACNKAHNIPDMDRQQHEIKWIWKASYEEAFGEEDNEYIEDYLKNIRIPILCNHCASPPCVRVCPTRSTWEREDGIVVMDYHRCIGCRFCMAACPYGARSFNWKDPRDGLKEQNPDYPTRSKGVVEKCNFCVERLTKGMIPACVEACPNDALVFGDLEDHGSDVRKLVSSNFTVRRKPGAGTEPSVYYIL